VWSSKDNEATSMFHAGIDARLSRFRCTWHHSQFATLFYATGILFDLPSCKKIHRRYEVSGDNALPRPFVAKTV
jgi:hypothetical protein